MTPELELFAQPETRKRASNGLECQNGPQGRDIHAEPPVTREVAGVGAFCERCGAGPGAQLAAAFAELARREAAEAAVRERETLDAEFTEEAGPDGNPA